MCLAGRLHGEPSVLGFRGNVSFGGGEGCPVKVVLGKGGVCPRRGLTTLFLCVGKRKYNGCSLWVQCKGEACWLSLHHS